MARQSTHYSLADTARQALSSRKSRQHTLLVLLALIACSAYLIISYPALAPRSPQVLRNPVTVVKAHWTSHRKLTRPKKLLPQVQLDEKQELAAVTAFLASLPQNVIPSNVDPSRPIDPQVVLDFDTRTAHAAEEVQALVEDVWVRNPVVLYAKYFSPVTREVKSVFKKFDMKPAPTIFDVDKRSDAHVLVPLLHRLVNSTDLPILLINGVPLITQALESRDDAAATESDSAPSTQDFIEKFRELEKSGELKRLLKSAGVTLGGRRKKGRKS
jgi:hypothetical protein